MKNLLTLFSVALVCLTTHLFAAERPTFVLVHGALSYFGEKVSCFVFIAAVAPYDGDFAFKALDPNRDTNFNLCATLQTAAGSPPNAGIFKITDNVETREKYFFPDLRDKNPELAD